MSHVMFKYWELFVSFTQLLKCFKIENVSINPPQSKHPFTDDMLNFSVDDIIKAIEDIKPNAASGPDEIPVTLLKNCKKALAEPMYIIWSRSLVTLHVFPLHKKDSRAKPANYRPISLTSHVVKVYERVIRKKLVNYLEINKLICSK